MADTSLFQKISAARGDMSNPQKNSTNPHFKSKFAGLEETMAVVEPALVDNGLDHMTFFNGTSIVYQVYCPETGESVQSSLDLGHVLSGLEGNVWQQIGQSFTYLRRYLAQAFWGLIPEDTDAQSAPSRPAAQRKPQQAHRSGDEELGQASGPSNGSGVL